MSLKNVEISIWDPRQKKRWRRMWWELGERVRKMPEWMQDIVLADVLSTVRNRLDTMEMIERYQRPIKSRAQWRIPNDKRKK